MAECLLMRVELTKGVATEYTKSECRNLVLVPVDNKLQTSLLDSVVFSIWCVASVILEGGVLHGCVLVLKDF